MYVGGSDQRRIRPEVKLKSNIYSYIRGLTGCNMVWKSWYMGFSQSN